MSEALNTANERIDLLEGRLQEMSKERDARNSELERMREEAKRVRELAEERSAHATQVGGCRQGRMCACVWEGGGGGVVRACVCRCVHACIHPYDVCVWLCPCAVHLLAWQSRHVDECSAIPPWPRALCPIDLRPVPPLPPPLQSEKLQKGITEINS